MNRKRLDSNSENTKAKKPKSKVVEWIIILVLVIILGKWIHNLQTEQKEAFFERSKRQAIESCGSDNACKENVNLYFNRCIENNYTSIRTSKFKKRYTFDLEGFKKCISSTQF